MPQKDYSKSDNEVSSKTFNHPNSRHKNLINKIAKNNFIAIDIGAGSGWMPIKLTKYFKKIYAIEPSEIAFKLAKRTHNKEKLKKTTVII